jgi:hypothetical protein
MLPVLHKVRLTTNRSLSRCQEALLGSSSVQHSAEWSSCTWAVCGAHLGSLLLASAVQFPVTAAPSIRAASAGAVTLLVHEAIESYLHSQVSDL